VPFELCGQQQQVIQQWPTDYAPATAAGYTSSAYTVPVPAYSYGSTPVYSSSSSYSAHSSDVANDVTAKTSYLQLQVTLLYSGNLCNEFMHWQSELHAHTGATSAATVATSLHALSHWRSYYTQRQHCIARLPVIDHLIRELYRFNAVAEKCAARSDTVVNDNKVLYSWSTALVQESHAAYVRLKQVCYDVLIDNNIHCSMQMCKLTMQALLYDRITYYCRSSLQSAFVMPH
jgi:hypothetical protein